MKFGIISLLAIYLLINNISASKLKRVVYSADDFAFAGEHDS
jgi:hypothetical protein